MFWLAWLAAGTFVSEDGTSILAGVLAREGHITYLTAVAGCAVGIYVGDVGLWIAGRVLGPRVLRSWSPRCVGGLDNPATILASRFIPGTRLPLYLAAGALGRRPRVFFTWTLVAVLVWTPLIVLGTASSLVFGGVLLLLMLVARRIDGRELWRRSLARLDRWRRWEFWPNSIVYAPVAPWIAWLAIRHRGLGVLAAANPAFPEGGFVGESKFEILTKLPPRWTIPAALLEPAPSERRLDALAFSLERRGWSFPLVLKPDAGQRGVGVRKVTDIESARAYLTLQPGRVLVQPYHAGPFEAGVFYYRLPHEAHGRIFSITDKKFPVLVGDGESTIEALIWRHPRFRLQAGVFLERHAAVRCRVLRAGEQIHLAVAGNHAQGTMFVDGSHLWTPALEARIDAIARSVPGFHIGRFDVRYSDVDRFREGEDLAIVELNGVTSESTNIYDPRFSIVHAWRILCRQWALVFEIGAANRARGVQSASVARLMQLSFVHLRSQPVLPIAS